MGALLKTSLSFAILSAAAFAEETAKHTTGYRGFQTVLIVAVLGALGYLFCIAGVFPGGGSKGKH